MSQDNKQVTVTLLGKTHQFACSPGQEQALLDAVELLNNKVGEMKQRDTVRNDQSALLMAALHLCHDLLDAKQKNHEADIQISTMLSNLSSFVQCREETKG